MKVFHIFRLAVLALAITSVAFGSLTVPDEADVPEINPASAASAIAVVSGAVLMVRGRRK